MLPASIVLAPGAFATDRAKTAHGLVRGTERFEIVGVVDATVAGRDAGEVLEGRRRGVPCFASVAQALTEARRRPEVCIVGIANAGGRMSAEVKALLLEAARAGLGIVSGLHELAGDDPEIAAAAAAGGAAIVDVRRPRPTRELHFWTGAIAEVRAPRVAVLGTDCALGKRTTARLLVEACRAEGLRAEMIYTGQTGWMQGGRWGFIFDSTPNDFVSGELEHAIVTCDREAAPDLIVIEGQSALRNPSGPCGAEMILSGGARGVILQHAPGRACYKGHEGWPIPALDDEIELVRLYGARVLAVALSGERLAEADLVERQRELAARLALPVVRPLEEGLTALLPQLRRFVEGERARRGAMQSGGRGGA